jgi:hypothetical protein
MAPPFVVSPQNPITANTFIAGQPGPSFAVGPGPSTGLQVADVTLTSAQILLLQTTPVTLIPAPGITGWMIVPRTLILRFLAGSAAYTDVGGAVSFLVGANVTAALASNAIFLVTTAPNRRTQMLDFLASAAGAGITGTAGNPPTEDNAAMTISKATNQFAAGNGTMHITVYYTVEPSL